MAYSKQTWNNGVTGGTPINADRLNHMEDGIENPVDSIPPGTYVRVNEGPLSLRDSRVNVLGDGTNESAKVASAITLAGVNGAIEIPGDMEVSVNGGQLNMLSGQSIIGHGKGSRLRRFAAGGGPLLKATTKTKVEFRDFAITGSASTYTSADFGIELIGTTDCAVRRVHVSGQGGDGIGVDNTANTRPVIEGCTVTGVYGHGIQFTGGTVSPRVIGNLVHDLAGGGHGYVLGYSPTYSSGGVIAHNRARSVTGCGFQYNNLEIMSMVDNFSTDCVHAHQFVDCRDLEVVLAKGRGGTPTASFLASFYVSTTTRCNFYGCGHDTNLGAANYGARIMTTATDNRFYDLGMKRSALHGIWVEGPRNRFYDPTCELNGGRGMIIFGAANTRVFGGQFEGNTLGQLALAGACTGTRVMYPELSNLAGAGANPTALEIQANVANCIVDSPDIHDIGSGTPILVDPTGTSTTKVRQRGHSVGLSKAGAVADSDFPSPPENGTYAVDSTNNRLYVRVGGVWKYSALT